MCKDNIRFSFRGSRSAYFPSSPSVGHVPSPGVLTSSLSSPALTHELRKERAAAAAREKMVPNLDMSGGEEEEEGGEEEDGQEEEEDEKRREEEVSKH